MIDAQAERDPVEALAEEFIESLRRGEHPSVEDYASRHPDLAAEIREVLPTVARMERFKLHKAATAAAGLPGNEPERLGDFRMLREIGRGGMGIVYEAEQESLGRRVAVKVLPPALPAGSPRRERFRREAETAARLHHSNIVPVLGVGEENGYHYIVMQLIQGVALDDCLAQLRRLQMPFQPADPSHQEEGDGTGTPAAGKATAATWTAPIATNPLVEAPPRELPLAGFAADSGRFGPAYWRSVAQIGLQVAQALHYAHRRGILHRDIKPANLILDADGVVWVTDFGLAKAIEEEAVTRTGDVFGTIRYMAPERLHGLADGRSDLYSLGLTLYELIALRPAFGQSDPGVLIRTIAEEGLPRLRETRPAVPRDLETIVLKATARDSSHRYPSAEAMAEDLRAFLEDRPIRARRASAWEHGWRWCRRNRAVASLIAAAAVLAMLVLVVASVGYVQTKAANLRTQEALAGEYRQRQRAEATSEVAMDTLDRIFDDFAPRRMAEFMTIPVDDDAIAEIRVPVQPVLSREAAALLEHMLASYDRLAQQSGDSVALRTKAADASRRVAEIHARLGHFEAAQRAYLRAIDGYRELEARWPAESLVGTRIAKIENELGNLRLAGGALEEARSWHQKALAELRRLPPATAAAPGARYEEARTWYLLGRAAPPEALTGLQPPGPAPLRPGFNPPRPKDSSTGETGPLIELYRESAENLQRAIEILTELVDHYPAVPDYRHLLACCYRDLPAAGNSKAATSAPIELAAEILQELVVEFPEVPDYRHDLAKTYAQIDFRAPLLRAGHFHTARERLQEAARIAEALIAEHPNVPDYEAFLVRASFLLGHVQRYGSQPEAAETSLRKALAIQSSLSNRFPEALAYRLWTAILYDSLARMLSDADQLDEALSLAQQSVATLEHVRQAAPEASYVEGLLARSYMGLAGVHRRRGERDKAAEAARRSLRYDDMIRSSATTS